MILAPTFSFRGGFDGRFDAPGTRYGVYGRFIAESDKEGGGRDSRGRLARTTKTHQKDHSPHPDASGRDNSRATKRYFQPINTTIHVSSPPTRPLSAPYDSSSMTDSNAKSHFTCFAAVFVYLI